MAISIKQVLKQANTLQFTYTKQAPVLRKQILIILSRWCLPNTGWTVIRSLNFRACPKTNPIANYIERCHNVTIILSVVKTTICKPLWKCFNLHSWCAYVGSYFAKKSRRTCFSKTTNHSIKYSFPFSASDRFMEYNKSGIGNGATKEHWFFPVSFNWLVIWATD